MFICHVQLSSIKENLSNKTVTRRVIKEGSFSELVTVKDQHEIFNEEHL
jgi:hypothetical protein